MAKIPMEKTPITKVPSAKKSAEKVSRCDDTSREVAGSEVVGDEVPGRTRILHEEDADKHHTDRPSSMRWNWTMHSPSLARPSSHEVSD